MLHGQSPVMDTYIPNEGNISLEVNESTVYLNCKIQRDPRACWIIDKIAENNNIVALEKRVGHKQRIKK